MTRVASLGMYDLPALRAANDRLWSALAGRLAAAGVEGVPDRLDRTRGLDAIWADPGLLLGQCCGYPLMTRYRGRLRYVATPRYRATGCAGADHSSRIVVRRESAIATLAELSGGRVAINDRMSNSGMNLFRAALAPLAGRRPMFDAVVTTGGHAESARRVASGELDGAAIDAVTFAHLERAAPEITDALRTLAWSPPVPGLPLVTATDTSDEDLALLRAALAALADDPVLAAVRAVLLVEGYEILPPDAYDAVLDLEADAVRQGYPALA